MDRVRQLYFSDTGSISLVITRCISRFVQATRLPTHLGPNIRMDIRAGQRPALRIEDHDMQRPCRIVVWGRRGPWRAASQDIGFAPMRGWLFVLLTQFFRAPRLVSDQSCACRKDARG